MEYRLLFLGLIKCFMPDDLVKRSIYFVSLPNNNYIDIIPKKETLMFSMTIETGAY